MNEPFLKMLKAARQCYEVIKDFTYEEIHRFYQYNLDRNQAEDKKNPVACKKGCFYCCYLSVETPDEEVEYILDKYRDLHGEENYLKIVATAREKQEKVKDLSDKERKAYHSPCTFLKDSLCSIYDYRPLNCRSMVVADSEPCKKSFYEKRDYPTPFHSYPKELLGVVGIALKGIQDNTTPEKALQNIANGNYKEWPTMEKAICNYDDKLQDVKTTKS